MDSQTRGARLRGQGVPDLADPVVAQWHAPGGGIGLQLRAGGGRRDDGPHAWQRQGVGQRQLRHAEVPRRGQRRQPPQLRQHGGIGVLGQGALVEETVRTINALNRLKEALS